MAQHPLGNLVLAAVLAFLPLAGAVDRMRHPVPWIAFAVGFLLTQPPLGLKKMVSDLGDRLSGLGIFAGVIGSSVAAVVQFGYRDALFPDPLSTPVIVGAIVAALGLFVRFWAIRLLGRFFTATVRVQDDQTIVDGGPYRFIRHPAYTGTLFAVAGIAIAAESPIGGALVLLLLFPMYLYRIHVEEAALVKGLGPAYDEYRKRSKRLIPFVL